MSNDLEQQLFRALKEIEALKKIRIFAGLPERMDECLQKASNKMLGMRLSSI
ncbi:hypothetical protein ACX1C1_12780 [Paenibacillus sp. strain BS8-2]